MTDEELSRYREIATDQAGHERNWLWLQRLCMLAAAAALGWALHLATVGYGRDALLALGLSVGLGYWPYRKIKMRRLWSKHCRAVGAELERRRSAA